MDIVQEVPQSRPHRDGYALHGARAEMRSHSQAQALEHARLLHLQMEAITPMELLQRELRPGGRGAPIFAAEECYVGHIRLHALKDTPKASLQRRQLLNGVDDLLWHATWAFRW